MNVGTVVSVVFPLLTLIAGGACILLFSITTTLRSSNGDLRDRVSDLEKALSTEEEKTKTLQSDLSALQKVVTGEVQLNAILTLLETHDKSTVAEHARIEKAVEQVREGLAALGHAS